MTPLRVVRSKQRGIDLQRRRPRPDRVEFGAIGPETRGIDSSTKGLARMLIFACTACDECISGAEDESTELILSKLERHVTKCRGAQYTCGAVSEGARKRAEALEQSWRNRPVAGRVRWP